MREHRLDRLAAPPARTGFHDELWDRVEAAERAATRRWRRTSIALAVIAIGAIATATSLAAALNTGSGRSVVDRTYSCVALSSGALPTVLIAAYVNTQGISRARSIWAPDPTRVPVTTKRSTSTGEQERTSWSSIRAVAKR